MQFNEKNISSASTSVLFIPKLPPLLISWNTLKTHFSQFGKVRSVVLNPQRSSATVSFETVSDAEYAKSKGCVWKNKQFQAVYYKDNTATCLDPRAKSEDVFGYSDLDNLWGDDKDEFGVVEMKLPYQKLKESPTKKVKERPSSKESTRKSVLETVVSLKSSSEKKSVHSSRPKSSSKKKSPPLKSSVEKRSPTLKSSGSEIKTRSMMALYSVKEKQKEAKRKVKEALLELKKKRHSSSSRYKDESVPSKSFERPSMSLKEKFAFLEERDKVIRKSVVKSSDVKTANAVIGTCPDMCPEKERIMREYRRLVSIYEMKPGTQEMDHNIAVKAYVRSSADQEEPLPHELRPEPVLSMTMSYLIMKIMPLIDDPDVNKSDWYDFCWDRLRGIRKDVIQQQLCSVDTVTIIEQCARFHICCYDYFWDADPSIFDEKINTENLMNCLQTLRHMYEDLSKENLKCPNEAEFNAYMILLNMKTGDLMATYQLFSETLQTEERIQTVVKLYLAFHNSMYSHFFKLVKNSTYLDTCLLQRYFYQVRVQALQAISRAYCPPNKSGSIPLRQLKNILKFDTAEDTELFCEGHGIMLKDTRRDFSLYRNDFFYPDTKIKSSVSSSLVTDKRVPLVEAVTDRKMYNLYKFENHTIHSSFSECKQNEMLSDVTPVRQETESSSMFFESSDKEVNEQLTDHDDDMEINSEQYFQCSDTFNDSIEDIQVHEIKDERMPMDTDSDAAVVVKSGADFDYSLKGSKTIHKDSNNDVVSKQHTPSNLSVKIEPQKEFVKEQSVSFHFGLAASNIFGTQSQVNDKVQEIPFRLKPNFGSEHLKNSMQNPEQNLFNSNKAVGGLKPLVEHIKQPTSFSVNKSIDSALTAGLKESFVFKLESKNDSIETNKCIESDVTSKSLDDSLSKNIGRCKSDSHLKDITNDRFNIKKQLSIQADNNVVLNDTRISKSPNKDISSNDKMKHLFDSTKERSDGEREEVNKSSIKLQEREKQILTQLRKDLRRRLKTVNARHFIRKWKQKVERIKENRKEFPLLVSTPVEQHEAVWGTVVNVKVLSTQTLLNRLKEKRLTVEKSNLILNQELINSVRYVGDDIAENIVSNNALKLELKDFDIPYYWKLVVSIPFSEESFFTKKFNSWLSRLFYASEDLMLGSVRQVKTSQGVSVYYCVQLVTGSDFCNQKDQLNGMNSLIFFNVSGVENAIERCRRFKNLLASNKSMKSPGVALVNIGKVMDNCNLQLINIINDKVKRCKLKSWVEEYWSDFSSVSRVLTFLTSSVNFSNNIRVCTLYSLLSRISEHLLNILDSVKIVSDELSCAVLKPNFIISFYNTFFSELEKLISDGNLRDYDIVPPEFKTSVHYLNTSGKELSSNITFCKSRRNNVIKALSVFKMPLIKSWPPRDAIDLLDTLDAYCDCIGCGNILPRLIRVIDIDDDIDILENLKKVSWTNIVDLIVRWLLENNKSVINKIVVLYNETALSELCDINFSFKLLYNNLDN